MGNAILRYLEQARPRSSRREVFLTLRAPIGPLSAGAMHHWVSTRLRGLEISSLRRGPHALRHACAGHLIAQGVRDSPRPYKYLAVAEHRAQGPAAICPVYFHSRRAPAISSGHRNLSKHVQPITAGDVPHIVAAPVLGCAAHQRSAVAHAGRCRSSLENAVLLVRESKFYKSRWVTDWLRSARRLGTAHPTAGNPPS